MARCSSEVGSEAGSGSQRPGGAAWGSADFSGRGEPPKTTVPSRAVGTAFFLQTLFGVFPSPRNANTYVRGHGGAQAGGSRRWPQTAAAGASASRAEDGPGRDGGLYREARAPAACWAPDRVPRQGVFFTWRARTSVAIPSSQRAASTWVGLAASTRVARPPAPEPRPPPQPPSSPIQWQHADAPRVGAAGKPGRPSDAPHRPARGEGEGAGGGGGGGKAGRLSSAGACSTVPPAGEPVKTRPSPVR